MMRLLLTFCIVFFGLLNILQSQPRETHVGVLTGQLVFHGNNGFYTFFAAPINQTTNINYILPRNPPLAGEALVYDNSGELIWKNISASAGDIGSGTPASGTFTSLSANNNFSVYPTGTGAGNTGEVRWYELAAHGTNYTAFKAADAMASNVIYTLPSADGSSGNILTTNGSGTLSWTSTVSGSNVSASGNLTVNGNTALGDANTDVTSLKGTLRVYDTDASDYTDIKGPDGTAQSSNLNFILPTNAGSSNNMLITDGSGNLSWSSAVNGTSVTASGDLAIGGNTTLGNANSDMTYLNGTLRVYDSDASNYTDIKGGNGGTQTANLDFILPTNAGSSGNVLTTNGSGTLSWATPVPNWSAPGTIGATTPNTGAFTTLSASGAMSLQPTGTGAGNTGEIRWYELATNGTNYTAFKAADAMGGNVTYTLPAADGSNGNMLTTNGSGTLSWSSSVNTTNVTASGDFSVDGNTSLGNAATDQTSLKGSLLIWDNNNTHYTAIKGGDGTAQSVDLDLILPTNAGSSGNVLTTNGSGTLSWATPVPNWSVPGAIGSTTPNSGAFTTLSASGAFSASGNVNIQPTGSGAGNTGEIRWYELAPGSNYTAFKAADVMASDVTYTLPSADGTSGQVLSTNGTGTLSWVTATPNWSAPGTIGATTPNTGAFTTLSASGAMSLLPTGSGAGNTGEIRWYELAPGTDYTAFKAADVMAASVTYTLPAADGTNGQSLVTNGSGTLSWASTSANWAAPGTIGSTTPNTGAFTTLSASGALTSGGNILVNPTGTSAGNTGEIRWYELAANGSNYTAFKATDAMAANVTYTLPAADGTAGQFLKTDGTGNLSWAASSSGADAASLQTYAVSASAPATGNSLIWNGTAWAPANATSSVQKLVLSEGTELNIDALRGANTFINDINISAHAFFKMVTAGANTNINGLANGENGRIIYLFNGTDKNITFTEENSGSLAVNRLILGVANKTINPDQVAVFIYSTTKNRWILISTT